MQRFFVPYEAVEGDLLRIVGDDAFHISRSLRMKKGETISACLPDRTLLTCELSSFSDNQVCATIVARSVCTAEPPYPIHLYQALPKGDKMDVIVQKAVECGVTSITPFESTFCIAKAGASFDKKLDRWNRIALEAAKQSGRGMVPAVRPLLSYEQMLSEAASAELPLFCYEGEGTRPLGQCLIPSRGSFAVIVGSEGGFSSREVDLAREHGMSLVGLGERILRCETASSFVLACLAFVNELT